ncbi:fibrinogen-binding adhesin SdrG C-terminal domain-containing protein [Staphylococcus hyicus]|uniref:fibrinogen-binding adhesin SdrG C-terminal domain-containing protein n=2 Tax=Staphylococcus hyicus TaxID=1284 RepID=UPI0009E34EBC|nr:fibrinogen-binding adhesin SdrG C-terminal domain-containing protein [Staphylococcus hyicus]RTX65962.1 YSIRK-type signal peptide-containing protein [Staphylococcus hyicus]
MKLIQKSKKTETNTMNNTQRYGIRKYKIGAASIALGTVVVIGMSESNEAAASEYHTSQVTTSAQYVAHHVEEVSTSAQVTAYKENATNNEVQKYVKNTSTHQAHNNEHLKQYGTDQQRVTPIVKPETKVTTAVEPKVIAAPQSTKVVESQKEAHHHIKGTDVTEKVTVVESKIEGHEGKKNITPHNAERVTLKYKWKFDNSIKAGDHFHFTISNNVDTRGVAFKKKVPEIKDKQNVVARGEVLENNKIRYTFTDYVNYKKDINAELSLNLYFNPVTVPNRSRQTVVATLGKVETKETFDVNYLDGVHDRTGSGVKVNGRIHRLDKDNRIFTHIAYINPDKKHLNAVDVVGYFRKGGTHVSRPKNVQIYEYVGKHPLAQSVYADFNVDDYKEVTKNVNLIVQENGQYKATLGNLNGKTYVIRFDGQYHENANDLSFATELTGHHLVNGYYVPTKLTWLNGVTFYSNNAHGNGHDRSFNGKSEHVEISYDTYKTEHHTQQGVLEESYDSKPIVSITESGSEFGHGHYQKTEEIEDTVTTDYITQQNLLEFNEDNTLPPSISGHAQGTIEEIEDTMKTDYITEQNLIEFEEELHIERGAHENMIFEEDTNDDKPFIKTGAHEPIEINENSIPKESGKTKGVIIEEESNPNHNTPQQPKEEMPEKPQPPMSPNGESPKIKHNIIPKKENNKGIVDIHGKGNKTPQNKPNMSDLSKDNNQRPSMSGHHKTKDRHASITISHTNHRAEQRPTLPETGHSSAQHSYIIGTVLSIFGFTFLVRRKCEKRH